MSDDTYYDSEGAPHAPYDYDTDGVPYAAPVCGQDGGWWPCETVRGQA
jgi:hypothetical protein